MNVIGLDLCGGDRVCVSCGATFYVHPSRDRSADRRGCKRPRFCSLACRDSEGKGELRPCARCGQTFRARPSDDRKAAKRGHQLRRFCSPACQHATYRGAGNPKWRGGTFYTTSGYVYQHAPTHPFATKSGYVMQHRLVMEASLGRYLRQEEEVHHKNHIRDDNRIENLELMPDKSTHRRHHAGYVSVECATCGTSVERSAVQRAKWDKAFCSRRCAALAASRASAARGGPA